MPDNIARLIEVEDDRVEGIGSMFDRWETNGKVSKIVNEDNGIGGVKAGMNKKIPIIVKKGTIHVQESKSSVNERSMIYANIGGVTIQIGYTDSQSYEKGGKAGTFIGLKGTALSGIRKSFYSNSKDTLDLDFRKWMIAELSKAYPDDYQSAEVEKDELHESLSEGGISFNYMRGSGDESFSFSFYYKGLQFIGIPIVERANGKYIAKLIAKNKKGIAGNQFERIVVGKDSKLLVSVGKMIDELIKVLEGTHSKIKKKWKVEDFQTIANSFQSLDV